MRQDMLSGIGGPMDPMPDDTRCCTCNAEIPEPTDNLEGDAYWNFEGFCNARCAAAYILKSRSSYTKEFGERCAKDLMRFPI